MLIYCHNSALKSMQNRAEHTIVSHKYYTVPQYLPILFAPGHALLIDWAIQLSLTWKDDFIVANYSFDDFVNMSLTCYRILAIWDGHQSWTKADS